MDIITGLIIIILLFGIPAFFIYLLFRLFIKFNKSTHRFILNSHKPSKLKQKHLKGMKDKISKWKEEGYEVDEIEDKLKEVK